MLLQATSAAVMAGANTKANIGITGTSVGVSASADFDWRHELKLTDYTPITWLFKFE